FVDLGSRLDYLLAGFGWGNMPAHLVEAHIAAGRLKRLDLKENNGRFVSLPIHIVHERGRPPGHAGRWLLDDLRQRLPRGDSDAILLPPLDGPGAAPPLPEKELDQGTAQAASPLPRSGRALV